MLERTLFEKRHIPQTIEKLERQSQDPTIWNDQKAANTLFTELRTLKNQWGPVQTLLTSVEDLLLLAEDAKEADANDLHKELHVIEKQWETLQNQLYLNGEFDHRNAFLTISSGAGGTEAQDWASMLLRMYLRYAEAMQWKTTLIEKTDGQEAGIKTATILIEGDPAYGYLKCERGTHRLVRLSPFNAKNLRQTSFALAEVIPEITETKEIDIPAEQLRIDTFRSGGAGGQHVNKTESAVRITHLPTNTVVSCQSERSQQQNKQHAMNMLRAKLLEKKREEEQQQKSALRGASQSADFGQQIRSYVLHPYQMVKDVRTGVETSSTQGVLDGDIQIFIEAALKNIQRKEPS
ncbi:peptide chain release factor 2 [Candidatus Peregrinibacteria bacterium CG10_big_fil_rev_8_21_14_0_10_49_16]|nr:MAG: peptide chain release factor 2 [Candidatus Peregrinibacteria bacterium CG10_big_fil_rev_8_21_14_0_10_49_16]